MTQTGQSSSKVTSGRTTKVKISSSKTKLNKGNAQSASKSIKVPPPTINPYNTMSNLKTHSSQQQRRENLTI